MIDPWIAGGLAVVAFLAGWVVRSWRFYRVCNMTVKEACDAWWDRAHATAHRNEILEGELLAGNVVGVDYEEPHWASVCPGPNCWFLKEKP